MPAPRLPKPGEMTIEIIPPSRCEGCGETKNDLKLCKVGDRLFFLCEGCLRHFTIQQVRASTGHVPNGE
jgi:hypothetical protein